MTFQFDKPVPPRGHVLTAQRALRVMTILVAVFGGGFLAWRWMNPPQPKPPAPGAPAATAAPNPSSDNEAEYDIDLRTFPLPRRGDNTIVTPAPPPDNISAIAAIVGLGEVKDGALIEPQPLYWLLREADEKHPADDLWMKRLPPATLAELRAKPQDFRGKPVAVRGRLVRVESSSLPENPSGVRTVFEGDVVVPGEGVCMLITTHMAPVRVGMTVELRGLFMKLMTYKANDGRMELAPLVVASHPVVVGTPPAPRTASPSGGLGGLVAVLAVLFVIYVVLQFVLRRRGGSGNRAIEARRRTRELLGRPMHDDQDLTPPTDLPPEDREP